jgi:hypothetical protein
VVIATEPFDRALQELARMCGAPHMQWVIVPHPIGSLDAEDLMGRAKAAAAQIQEIVLEGLR